MPVTGPGKGGRVGASATQHVVQNLVRDTTRDEDVSLSHFPPLLFCCLSIRLFRIHASGGCVFLSDAGCAPPIPLCFLLLGLDEDAG